MIGPIEAQGIFMILWGIVILIVSFAEEPKWAAIGAFGSWLLTAGVSIMYVVWFA